MSLVLPKAFLEASATISEAKSKIEARQQAHEALAKPVTARIDMSAEVAGAGRCPECKQPMEESHANGIPVLICKEHRIVIPMSDAPAEEQAE
jgi:hypothetical protein